MNILLLAGSPAIPSRSTRLLHHAGEALALLGHRSIKLHVRDLPARALLHADLADASLQRALALVADADAVVIATPIYKAAYSGVLKAFLDLLPQNGLHNKPVLPIATGGSQSHLLALDYALRPVLAALSAGHILPSVFATDAQVSWSTERGLVLDDAVSRRLQQSVTQLAALLHVRSTVTEAAQHAHGVRGVAFDGSSSTLPNAASAMHGVASASVATAGGASRAPAAEMSASCSA